MSVNYVKRALRTLPYTEMKALGDQIVATLRERAKPKVGIVGLDPEEMCEVLATLPIRDDKMIETEDVFLARAFTKKRGGACELKLKKAGSGWEVRTGDFQHTAATVRGAVSELLDQIAAYEALMAGEGRAL